MDVLKGNQTELETGVSAESFHKFLDSQRDLFHGQVDQLQNIVVKQCKLTGVNPLSQEMAAGALSVKIGKRPRDLLNPKAVKYMQSIFAIKDAVSKKESREISALFGITITQVRDFFASQRSRVRKFVHLSREKAARSISSEAPQDEAALDAGPSIIVSPVPLNSVHPPSAGEAPSCSTNVEALPSIVDSEKTFICDIFKLMRQEETFSGQVKLMEWILTMQNSSVLTWFLSKGGVMILATWLSQAAIEEQTSVLLVILKVLCHLPLHRALPVHMSAILQSVNRLRFYRAQDISNRARVLLSRWSKIFARTQAMKRPSAIKSSSDVQSELLLKQSIGEIMNHESWQSKADFSEDGVTPPCEIPEKFRKLESSPVLKLLPSSSDDSNRKHVRGVSVTQNRERRKVQLVEQPGQKTPSRNPISVRAVSVGQGRPMSADDIQKAKMRAIFMQNKRGKIVSEAPGGSCWVKSEDLNRPSSPPKNIPIFSSAENEAHPNSGEYSHSPVDCVAISDRLGDPVDLDRSMDQKEPLLEVVLKRVRIPWHTPPAMLISPDWRVGAGESSKEVGVQKNRISREKEIVYPQAEDIPAEPREPWDLEMDFDDSLTPEIPTEPLPDEPMVSSAEDGNLVAAAPAPVPSQTAGSGAAPDLELLAVLLKNPELVFSLTSGQACGLSGEETVKLLDMIKSGVVRLPGSCSSNGWGARAEERAEVCLPSPTPATNPTTSGWRAEVARSPFTQHDLMAACTSHSVAVEKLPPPTILPMQQRPQLPRANPSHLSFHQPGPPQALSAPLSTSNSGLLVAAPDRMLRNESDFLARPTIMSNVAEQLSGSVPQLPAFSPSYVRHQPTVSHLEKPGQGLLGLGARGDNRGCGVAVPGCWEREDLAMPMDFRRRSPEGSPTRPSPYVSRRNMSPALLRPGSGRQERPDRERERGLTQQRNSLGYRDYGRHGDRRWRDRDRDRRR